MNLDNLIEDIIDLSKTPSIHIITKLKKGDVIRHKDSEYFVEIPPKRLQKTIWVIGLINRDTGAKSMVKLVEDTKPSMTPHEKKVMLQNIKIIVEEYKENEEKLIELVQRYYFNLSEHNRYCDDDVRECMSLFPTKALIESGIVL